MKELNSNKVNILFFGLLLLGMFLLLSLSISIANMKSAEAVSGGECEKAKIEANCVDRCEWYEGDPAEQVGNSNCHVKNATLKDIYGTNVCLYGSISMETKEECTLYGCVWSDSGKKCTTVKASPTGTPSKTPTKTSTPTATFTLTSTPTFTSTPTASSTNIPTSTSTITTRPSSTRTPTHTRNVTNSPTSTTTITLTPLVTLTNTETPTQTDAPEPSVLGISDVPDVLDGETNYFQRITNSTYIISFLAISMAIFVGILFFGRYKEIS